MCLRVFSSISLSLSLYISFARLSKWLKKDALEVDILHRQIEIGVMILSLFWSRLDVCRTLVQG